MDNKQVDRRNKWQQENQERIVVMTSKKESPTKNEIKLAAKQAGMSVNAWILDAIRDKL
jgi:DNA-directed RNA polymerase subunit E'/Rpb7